MNIPAQPNTYRSGPDERGHFGLYGGRFVAETLMPLVLDLEAAYEAAKADPAYQAELTHLNTHYTGRPSPLYFAERLTEHLREVSAASGRSGGAKIYFKRDELNHTGSHKINNCLGQILLARRMGKTRIIAETGAGQHGVAAATVCARFGAMEQAAGQGIPATTSLCGDRPLTTRIARISTDTRRNRSNSRGQVVRPTYSRRSIPFGVHRQTECFIDTTNVSDRMDGEPYLPQRCCQARSQRPKRTAHRGGRWTLTSVSSFSPMRSAPPQRRSREPVCRERARASPRPASCAAPG